ncbi:MAG: amidophosphoribosyltransferase [Microthrixaceae bacterium]
MTGPALSPGDLTDRDLADDGRPGEECGVFGVYAPGKSVGHLCYLGIFALQHRGQESAGIATSDGKHLTVVKDMGLVSSVFDDRTLAALDGQMGIGHTRYSTTGSSAWQNSQPVYRDVSHTQFALAHNGNLTNTAALAEEAGMLPGMANSDTEVMAELLSQHLHSNPQCVGHELEGALMGVLPSMQGAFSLVITDAHHIIGVRDPNGFRPLCLGRLDGGWVLASESPALDVVGAHFVRELDPGEMVIIDQDGVRSVRPFPEERVDPKLCLFEFVYFARPDSTLYGRNVHLARVRMGEQLAEQAPVDADLVMGVPESGLPAAEGYARHSGIPYGHGLVKNRYIGRTFIAPDAGHAGDGGPHEAQPAAGEHRRQAADRRRRLDRARHDHPGDGADAAGGRRRRGPHAGVVTAVPLALLLRHGHGDPWGVAGRQYGGSRDPRLPRRRHVVLPRPRPSHRRDRRADIGLLHRLPDR